MLKDVLLAIQPGLIYRQPFDNMLADAAQDSLQINQLTKGLGLVG